MKFRCSALAFLLALLAAVPAHAQKEASVSDGARFIPASDANAPLLRSMLSVDFDGAPMRDALRELSRQMAGRLFYDDSVAALPRRVTLRHGALTAGAALREILANTDVEIFVSQSGGLVVLKRVPGSPPGPVVATIMGTVTEAETGNPVQSAQITVDGRGRTFTNADGAYRIGGVISGRRTIAVTSIGYADASSEVEVGDGATVTADFALELAPTALSELVVTATGQQRRVELGHVVGRINADSVVKEAPVATLSELLTGRVSGVQVFQAAGTVGGEVHVQIRGPNSLLLNTEPIVVVDGVRYTSSAGAREDLLGSIKGESTSPLNDLNPNDIETVEVVKGPSAATLYGTDAANGVLVITTKRGRAGPARWNFHVTGSQTEIPKGQFPEMYAGYGHLTSNNEPTTTCSLRNVSGGNCVQDSVAVFQNPLEDPDLTLFKSEPSWETGANVSGGLGDLRYYFSANYEDATGPIRMPTTIAEELAEVRGELPDEVLRPNTLNKLNLRANMAALLGEELDLRVNTGYTRSMTRAIQAGASNPYVYGVSRSSPDDAYYSGAWGPAANFSRRSTESIDRFIGNANAQWRPASWVLARAQVGLDLAQRSHYGLVARGEGLSLYQRDGVVQDDRVRQLSTTADIGVTATKRAGPLSARTAVGAQYVRRVDDGLFSLGRDLPPGATSVGEGAIREAAQSYSETVTLGAFVEETIGLNDRLFLTGALRADGASAFGRDYEASIYPKASVSWLVSEEPFVPRVPGLDELRLRYAFGVSGQQPLPDWAQPSFVATPVLLDGVAATAIGVNTLGNPELQPERVREHEFGFDVSAIGNRLQAGLTWYSRRTVDQIVSMPLAPGLGSIFTNLGLTTQSGFEAELATQLIDSRLVSLNLRYQYGLHGTELVDLGDAAERRSGSGSWVEGYSLGARFQEAPIIGYEDVDGNGILSGDEIQLGDTAIYVGEGIPPRTQSLTSVVGFFDRRLRISALLERRSGFVQLDGVKTLQCSSGRCRAAVDPSAPLAEQAEVVAPQLGPYRFFQPGDFTRLRELTLAIDVPRRLVRAIRAQSATLTIAGRNLALWSAFEGADPEVASVQGISSQPAEGIPLGQTWTVRFDLGY